MVLDILKDDLHKSGKNLTTMLKKQLAVMSKHTKVYGHNKMAYKNIAGFDKKPAVFFDFVKKY